MISNQRARVWNKCEMSDLGDTEHKKVTSMKVRAEEKDIKGDK